MILTLTLFLYPRKVVKSTVNIVGKFLSQIRKKKTLLRIGTDALPTLAQLVGTF